MTRASIAVPALIVLGVAFSCTPAATTGSSPAPTPAASPAPAPSATAAQAPAGRGAGGAGGQTPGGGRGPQMTPEQRAAMRDSVTQLRAATIASIVAKLGPDTAAPANQTFKNVQIFKGTAGQLLNTMNAYGRALSVNCTFCHVDQQWDNESKPEKATTRVMMNMVTAINTEQLSKMRPNQQGRTPTIGCTTCHRGFQTPGRAPQIVP